MIIKQKAGALPPGKLKRTGNHVEVIEMKFSGISRNQLLVEMRAHEVQLSGDVEFFACNVGWYGRTKLDAVKAELSDVREFIGTLSGKSVKAAKPRCAFHKTIQRAFAIANDRGFNTKDDEAMRGTFSLLLGRTIESREEMSASDWQDVGNRLEKLPRMAVAA